MAVPSYQKQWNEDYSKLQKDEAQWADAYNQYLQSIKDYATAMKKVAGTKDAMVAFLMLAYLFANQGSNQLNLKQAVDAGSLQVQGDLTKLNNDLQSMTNTDSSVTGENGPLDWVAKDSQQIYTHLTTDPYFTGQGQKSLGTTIIDPTASKSLADQFKIIRNQIYDPYTDPWTPPADNKYSFDATGQDTSVIDSYAEFQKLLSEKGDQLSVNEVQEQKTNAFNSNTSTTQSTNAASQEYISYDANMTKAVQAFLSDMFHAMASQVSAAIQATQKGS